jgi:hypothetical protein
MKIKRELILVNKKALMAFKGKHCQCYICKHTQCFGDVTHIGIRKDTILYLCWHCADVMEAEGFRILEIVF